MGSHQLEERLLCFNLPSQLRARSQREAAGKSLFLSWSIKIMVGFEENDQGALGCHDFIEFGKSVEEKVLYICRHNLLTHFPSISSEKI